MNATVEINETGIKEKLGKIRAEIVDSITEQTSRSVPDEGIIYDIEDNPEYKSCTTEEKELIRKALKEDWIGRRGHKQNAYSYRLSDDATKLICFDSCIGTVLFRKEDGRINALIKFNERPSGYGYYGGMRRYIRSCGECDIKCPAEKVDDILYNIEVSFGHGSGRIDTSNLRVDPESVRSFYVIGKKVYTKLGKAAADHFYAHPEFIERREVNTEGTINAFGISMLVWSNTIINTSYSLSIDCEITEEEAAVLTDGREGYLAEEIACRVRAIKNRDEEDKKEKLKKINAAIEELEKAAKANLEKAYAIVLEKRGRPITEGESAEDAIQKEDGKFGFDCGWLNFYFRDRELRDLSKEAYYYTDPNDHSYRHVTPEGKFWLRIFNIQSTTLQKMVFDEIMSMGLPYEIGYTTQLD